MDIREVFAVNVRKYRKAAHLSQEKLAEKAGLHRTYIGGIEQQRINVSLKNIGIIADALNVSPATLLTNDKEVDSSKAGSIAVEHVEELSNNKDGLQQFKNFGPGSVALAVWNNNDSVEFYPIESHYENVTIQLLVSLIDQGYSGKNLAEKYCAVSKEIKQFLTNFLSDTL